MFAADDDFARFVLRVGRVDLHFELFVQVAPARSGLELVVGREADERRALGHAVADGDRELDLHQERFGLLIHRCAADDEYVYVVAEGLQQFFADHRVDGRVEQRNLHGDRHGAFFEHRHHLLAVDLFEDHRYAADDRRLDHGHGFQQDLGRRDFTQQGDVPADGQRREEVEGAAVGVGQRQERQRASALAEIVGAGLRVDHAAGETYVAREVVHREHHSLRIARGARRVVEQDDLVVGDLGVLDVVYAEPARIFRTVVFQDIALELGERLAVAFVDGVEIGERKHGLDLAYLVFFDDVPEVVAQKEQLAFRVVDDVDDVGRGEILQYRDDYGAVGDRGDVGDAPPGIVAPDQRYLVALLYAGLFEQEVQLGDLLGHLVIRECFALEIVGQCRHFTVLAETRLVYFYQVFL